MTRRQAYVVVAAAAVVPRLAVLLHERDDILESFTEKSDEFARTFVDHGTFGFLPGEPSAWTQPLYSFFLIPIYWIAGREWWSVGFAQIAVAAVTALVVYETGVASSRIARGSSPRSWRRSARTSSGTTSTSTASCSTSCWRRSSSC